MEEKWDPGYFSEIQVGEIYCNLAKMYEYQPDDLIIFKKSAIERSMKYMDTYMGVEPKIGVPQNGWFIMVNPIKMDDLGVPLFLETPILHSSLCHINNDLRFFGEVVRSFAGPLRHECTRLAAW